MSHVTQLVGGREGGREEEVGGGVYGILVGKYHHAYLEEIFFYFCDMRKFSY